MSFHLELLRWLRSAAWACSLSVTQSALGPLAVVLSLLAASQESRAEQGQIDRGRAIAERWCAKCHAITLGRRSAEPGAPSFMQIAADPDLSRAALRQLIRLPHYEMPAQSLTTPEIEDVIGYILSLRR